MLSLFNKKLSDIENALVLIVGVSIFIVMILTSIQIISRVVGYPWPAFLELSELAISIFAFLGVAYAQRMDAHIRMDSSYRFGCSCRFGHSCRCEEVLVRKKEHIDEQIKYLHIINPNSLREFRQSRIEYLANKRKKSEQLKRVPNKPHYGIGIGGHINSENFSEYILKSKEKNVLHNVDPQKALLSWDKKSKDDQYFTSIYNINQPKTIFAEIDNNEIINHNNMMDEDGNISNQINKVIATKGDIDRLKNMTNSTTMITGNVRNRDERSENDILKVKVPPKKKRKLNF